jgi:hypothetical protein
MALCATCAHEMTPGEQVCPSCGTRIETKPAAAPKRPPMAFDELALRAVLGGFLVLVVLAVGFVGWSIASQGISAGAP